jgi:tRNA(Arg) A34 adenosine deaminase TadA
VKPEEIMKQLVDETQKQIEENNAGPFGAAIVVDGEIVATGVNSVCKDSDPTAHGEVVAIRNAAKKLGVRFPKDTIMYTTSQSCPMCVAAAIWAGVKKIYYAASCEFDDSVGLGDGHVYSYLRGNENPDLLVQEQIGENYATEMLQWFEKRKQ